MSTLIDKLKVQKNILENQGYTVAYICIYGSQNYSLDVNTKEYQSDVDMKAIVVPKLDDLVYNSKPVSTVVDTEWGQCDIKDIRSYFQTLLKANPAYIETVFTDYHVVDEQFHNEFSKIFRNAENLVHALREQFIRAMYGMMCEKEKAMCHPYPSIVHKIEKYGYDGKQIHHVYRLLLMMKDYFVHGYDLGESFYPLPEEINLLMDLKLNKIPLDDAKVLVKKWMSEGKELRDKVLSEIEESKIDYRVKDDFLKLSQDIIKHKIKRECVTEVLNEWLN